jgi:serine/threonine protein kinase
MIGQTVSHYRIIEPLGEGGMGTVYLAEDTLLGRRVAVKFPIPTKEHDFRGRFLREARAISELSHPGIAVLFDYGETSDGQPFLVMELCKGQPLSDLIRKGRLSLSSAVDIVTQVATALAEAHARNVIHRDIKPSNIMVDEQGRAKVLDFGLAKQLTEEQVLHSEPEALTLLSAKTGSGVVLGTPAYLSPEQATGGAVDGRSDLFALGAVLYESITGEMPFSGNTLIEIASKVLQVDPEYPSKRNPRIPNQLDFVTLKALAKKPEKRYQSAAEMAVDLRWVSDLLGEDSSQTLINFTTKPSLAGGHSRTLSNLSQILQRPRIPIYYILIALAIALVAGVAAFNWLRPTPHRPPPEAQKWYDEGTNSLREGAYYQASKAVERAIALDDKYMLAHARLAEALVELDAVEKAKDELLRVTAADRSTFAPIDLLYLDAITATARHDFAKAIEFYKQIAQQSSDVEKPYVLVDLGRAYEKNEEIQKAIENYSEATTRNAQYPTAFLRLGILQGRQDQGSAMASLAKAEAIYQALGNLEGRAEVAFQRGALLNKGNKLAEAKVHLDQALSLARAADNKSQESKTLLQLSSLTVDLGDMPQATDYARQAIELAQKNGMENLATRGLVDLGNAYLVRGEYGEAEKYLTQALEAAQRNKARRNEARANFSLASLRIQQSNPDEALRHIQPALAFYQQGGYRTETSQGLGIVARANLLKGDYEGALKADREVLQIAEQMNDQSQIAFAHTELGSVLSRQEKYPEALDHLNHAYGILKTNGIQRSLGFNLLGRASLLWQLGRYPEAEPLLTEATAIAANSTAGLKRLAGEIELTNAEIALSLLRFSDAEKKTEAVLSGPGKEFPNLVMRAKSTLGLAASHAGSGAKGVKMCTEVFEAAKLQKDPGRIAAMQLALARAMSLAGDADGALSHAMEAQQSFSRLGQMESEWQADLIVALANRSKGQMAQASEYAQKALELLTKLEQAWGPVNFGSYVSRPDIKQVRQQLNELSSSGR